MTDVTDHMDEAGMRRVIAGGARPEPPGAVANVSAFVWRTLLKIKHMPEQMFDVIITPIMFTVMFTYLFGGALAGSTTDYLQFLLPGILVQTVMFTTIYAGFTLNTDISKGVYDRFRSLPIWRPSPIVGALAGDTIRYTLSSVIVVLVGLILGFRPEAGLAGVVASILLLNLFGFGMSWVFVVLGLIVRTPAMVMTTGWLFLMPVTFASNIYVATDTMPGWLQEIVAFNPVAIITTTLREFMSGTYAVSSIGASLVAPVAITLILGSLAMAPYQRRR